jgi:crossover junction endodeoxyribonuclease RusA
MVELVLGWPPSELSPNKRLHWAKVSKFKAAYREACWAVTLEQAGTARTDIGGDLHLILEFVPPDRRSYDRDNLVARMKSGLDGVADALKINDKQFTTLTARVDARQVGGFVRVRIQGENSWQPKSTT